MQFLRQNVFYVVLLACVLVLGGIILAMTSSKAEAVEAGLKKRADLSSRVTGLSRPPMVSAAIRTAEKQHVEEVNRSAQEVVEQAIDWNRQNYDVLMLTAEGRETPAFPIDQDKYRRFRLQGQFNQRYLAALRELVASCKPATLPTAQQRAAELANRLAIEQARAAEAARRASREGATELPPMVEPGPGEAPWERRPGMMPYPEVQPGAAPASADVTRIAQEKADAQLKLKAARGGQVFVDLTSLDLKINPDAPDPNPTDDVLWFRQVNLWLTQDILTAINQTNAQVMKDLPADQKNVLNSAVKRVVSITLPNAYYTGQGLLGSTGTGAVPAKPVGGYNPMGPMEPMGQPEMGPPPIGPSPSYGSGGTAGAQQAKGDTLTQRVSNPQYDVLHYRVVLIMPARHLKRLQENLMARNFHTILRTDVADVSTAASPAQGAGGMGLGGGVQSDLYYYGTDPVVQVTIDAELLLLTRWERGTWDPQANAWAPKFPPLMPRSVLATLSDAALRDEDRQNLPATPAVR